MCLEAEVGMAELHQENEELKRKIEQLEKAMSVKTFDTAHIKALVEPFSGDGTLPVNVWIEKLESAFGVLKLNKQQQLVAACDLLTETAAIFRKTIPLTTEYEDLKDKLLQEFSGQKLSDDDMVKKLRAIKSGNKNILRYVLEVVEMAIGYDISEEDLVDIIIDGLGDQTNAVIMLYGVKNIAQLKSLLPRYEKRRAWLIQRKATYGY